MVIDGGIETHLRRLMAIPAKAGGTDTHLKGSESEPGILWVVGLHDAKGMRH